MKNKLVAALDVPEGLQFHRGFGIQSKHQIGTHDRALGGIGEKRKTAAAKDREIPAGMIQGKRASVKRSDFGAIGSLTSERKGVAIFAGVLDVGIQ